MIKAAAHGADGSITPQGPAQPESPGAGAAAAASLAASLAAGLSLADDDAALAGLEGPCPDACDIAVVGAGERPARRGASCTPRQAGGIGWMVLASAPCALTPRPRSRQVWAAWPWPLVLQPAATTCTCSRARRG